MNVCDSHCRSYTEQLCVIREYTMQLAACNNSVGTSIKGISAA